MNKLDDDEATWISTVQQSDFIHHGLLMYVPDFMAIQFIIADFVDSRYFSLEQSGGQTLPFLP